MQNRAHWWKAALGFGAGILVARWLVVLVRGLRKPLDQRQNLVEVFLVPLLSLESRKCEPTIPGSSAAEDLVYLQLCRTGFASPQPLPLDLPVQLVLPRRRPQPSAPLVAEEVPGAYFLAGGMEEGGPSMIDEAIKGNETSVEARIAECPLVTPEQPAFTPPEWESIPVSWSFVRFLRKCGRLVRGLLALLLLPVTHRKLRLITASAAAVALLWTSGLTRGMQGVFDGFALPLKERAAFTWQERFDSGLGAWMNPSALAPEGADTVQVRGLALYSKTMALRNYEMNFEARAHKHSIGWVVRAADPFNYNVFKLTERGRSEEGRKYDLVRYTVLDGRAPVSSERETVHLVLRAPESDFLNISVRV
ncbi:MAG: hypothetical protein HY236_02735, partial [Acidobacteria bacterium]|nr:hypothetical protein [Acidobacteriota bacterium]